MEKIDQALLEGITTGVISVNLFSPQKKILLTKSYF